MEKAKLVVVFPIYNGAQTMRKSLQCIADQDFSDFRAIIVDNKSTDATLEIAREFCAQDERFEVIQQERHLGVIDNFIFCIKLGAEKGEYFCLRACDDLSTSDYLSALLHALEQNPDKLLAVGSSERIDADKTQILKPEPNIFNFQENASQGKVPRGLRFPSEWFYGVYRSAGGADILLERWPALGGPWCAASYAVAEFVMRDLIVWVDGPMYIFFRGSDSEQLYAAKSITHKIQQRWLYAVGCYRVVDKLPPLSWNTRRKIFKMAWRDARGKTNYRIRRHVLQKLRSLF